MSGKLINTKGIVLSSVNLKDNDKIVTILTEKLGKITAVIKGARIETNKNKIFSLEFNYSDIHIYKGKSMYSFNEGTMINSFQNLLNDIDNLSYACYFCELVGIVTVEGEKCTDVFVLLAKTLYLLESKSVNLKLLAIFFNIKLLKYTGSGFNLELCNHCGEKFTFPEGFSIEQNAFICSKCLKDKRGYNRRISEKLFKAINYMDKNDIRNVVRFNFSDELIQDMNELLEGVLKNTFYRLPKSLEILNLMKE